ncbi:MAG: hypothetical protein M1608_02835 [Candidatus Omnitrophica bacterium]|nr:hypothetical protein [Candidatus Omnitrophota bacterium]
MDTKENRMDLGKTAYEAAAKVTGCTQQWEEATQEKWKAAAAAVAVAVIEAQMDVAKATIPTAYFATHPDMTDRCDGGKPRELRREHVVSYIRCGWHVWGVTPNKVNSAANEVSPLE